MPSSDDLAVDALRDDPALRSRGLEIHEVLGEGGSSIVYRARDTRHARDVAIKVIRDAGLEHAVERFNQEVRVAAGLRHAHLFPIFDSGTLGDGRVFSVMPVAQGRPLRAMISEGPLAVADAVRLAREVAEALAHLHRSGYVHRDVKPENILVESGHAVLTDFGLAVPLHGTNGHRSAESTAAGGRLADADAVSGTFPYMSPEALLGEGPIDGRMDIYALGIVLYEMLAGEPPFRATTPLELMARRSREVFPSIMALRADVPLDLDAVIARCCAMQPDARFATAEELAAALSALRPGPTGKSSGLFWRDRVPTSVGLLVLLLALIGGASAWQRARRAAALDPQRVVVADLANDTGDSSLTRVGSLAGDFITAEVTAAASFTVVNAAVTLPSRQQRNLPIADSTLDRQVRALVASTRAGLVVTGAYFRAGRALEIVAEVTDTRSGRVLGIAGPVSASLARPDSALRVLGDSVVAILRRRHAPPT